ncbi:MAG: dihydropteroate synthase, partial [Bacteroidales bacterium]|nr:dihydropteroate synthase [Bacteroidales bacterium]
TVFDTLNAKAAIFALERLRRDTGCEIPLMISVTVSQKAGRTLSGQTIEAFWTSVKHGRPLSVGINCSFGAREMLPHLERLAAVADCYISVHPNAGLPNISGGYDETPESFADAMKPYAERGLVNIMGGCCGTTPSFIKALGPLVDSFAPRRLPDLPRETVVCGLEALRIVPEANFINIGERCNVAGSAKFARMIREGDYAGAIAVARTQVAAGAQIIDVCMDDGLIDGPAAMRTFLNMAAGEVDIARVPFMIDSSSLDTIVAGLECCQGKAIVNSISLKEGPEEFLRRAALIRSYGAAAVVMLFDEEGQATSFERKIAVARRAYDLLIESGFPAEDIIFDPNILAVATGIKEHDRYALDFIEATRWIKENLPYAKVSGGVSNLSFAFRGNNAVREAMHSAFLYHARLAGMDMGIVNPQMLRVYDDIPGELLERVEDVVLCRRADACERLSEYAAQVRESAAAQVSAAEDWRAGSPQERISYAMLHGIADHIEEDCLEALKAAIAPLEVINKMMMPAMERVGALFGEGKMFLPQVVKAAGVMKRGVSALMGDVTPGSGSEKASLRAAENIEPAFPTRSFSTPGEPGTHPNASPCVVIATVKGDIHDIGKNIVSVVLSVGGCSIVDLGVMVEPGAIVEAVKANNADYVCLSGLITPSLEQMIVVLRHLKQAGITIPVIVGGATTSPMHTAVKMAPEYDGLVVHSTDASRNIQIINQLQSPIARVHIAGILAEQQRLRDLYTSAQDRRPLEDYHERLATAEAARGKRETAGQDDCCQRIFSFHHYDINAVEKHLDWNMFFAEWGVKDDASRRELKDEALQMLARIKREDALDLQGVIGTFPVRVQGDDIFVGSAVFPTLRNQTAGEENLSVADFAAAAAEVTLFAISAGIGLKQFTERLKAEGDEYGAFMAKTLADALTEALADEVVPAKEGERHAFGYPSCPDHSLKAEAFRLLNVEQTCDLRLTDSYMIDPAESICGMVIRGARYCAVGHIGADQLSDYARRRNISEDTLKTLIPRNIL